MFERVTPVVFSYIVVEPVAVIALTVIGFAVIFTEAAFAESYVDDAAMVAVQAPVLSRLVSEGAV